MTAVISVWKSGLWKGDPQLHGDFEHGVSILDLLFNVGADAPEYIWGWRDRLK